MVYQLFIGTSVLISMVITVHLMFQELLSLFVILSSHNPGMIGC